MIEYKCDRCGKRISADWRRVFTVEFKPPEIRNRTGKLMGYPDGEYHFCEECIEKIQECIDELERCSR